MKKITFLALFSMIPFFVQSQTDAQTAALASTKSNSQALAKAMINTWDPSRTYYTTAMVSYSELEGAFNGWIDFCTGQGEKLINNKKHKIEEAEIKARTEDIVLRYTELRQYFLDNNEAAMFQDEKGIVTIEAAATVVDLFNNVINLIKSNKKQKKEEQLSKLKERLAEYKVSSWDELKISSSY